MWCPICDRIELERKENPENEEENYDDSVDDSSDEEEGHLNFFRRFLDN